MMRNVLIAIISVLAFLSSSADDITNVMGKVYSNAQVVRIEPDGISLKHSSGISKVYFTELSTELQQKYGFDPRAANSYRQQVIQARQYYNAALSQPQVQINSKSFPVHLFNIIGIKDRSVKKISGISAYMTDWLGQTHLRPVAGGLYRVRFDIKNNGHTNVKALIKYGDYLKEVYVPANSRKEAEEISGVEKYYELFVTVNGEEKVFSFHW